MTESTQPLRVGFVPEHFSTPLYFAVKHFGLNATLIPFPSGTGHMVTALRSGEIDFGIGLTEGWIAGLGTKEVVEETQDGGYKIVGTYVESPLCWAISTSPNRSDLNSINDLKNTRVGVSRIGSGSYVMSFVLADQQGWLSSSSSELAQSPFMFTPLQTFANLRQGVNDNTIDFFMWEHFTSKKYYDNGEIKRIGEIYTPWPSWMIVASTSIAKEDERVQHFFNALDEGVKYFGDNQEEAVKYISTELDYSEADAREWLKTVSFTRETRGVEGSVLSKVQNLLLQAGVLDGRASWQTMV